MQIFTNWIYFEKHNNSIMLVSPVKRMVAMFVGCSCWFAEQHSANAMRTNDGVEPHSYGICLWRMNLCVCDRCVICAIRNGILQRQKTHSRLRVVCYLCSICIWNHHSKCTDTVALMRMCALVGRRRWAWYTANTRYYYVWYARMCACLWTSSRVQIE